MTSPLNIIQQPSVGQQITPGINALLQALQARQQQMLQQQQLAVQQTVAQANIERSRALTEQTRLQTETAAREAKGMADATKLFQELVESGQEFNKDVLYGALAKLKSSEAISAFITMVPNVGNLLATPTELRGLEADVRTREAGADVAEAEAPVRIGRAKVTMESIKQAQRLIEDPTSRLPSDPTIGQAIGLAMLGALDFVSEQNRIAMQGLNIDAQERMLGRQAAIDVMRQSVREYNEQLESAGIYTVEDYNDALEKGEIMTLEDLMDRNAQALMGLTGEEVRTTVRDAYRQYQRAPTPADTRTTLNSLGLLSEDQRGAINRTINGRVFLSFPKADQDAMLREALLIVNGQRTLPLKGDIPERQRQIMEQLVRQLRRVQ